MLDETDADLPLPTPPPPPGLLGPYPSMAEHAPGPGLEPTPATTAPPEPRGNELLCLYQQLSDLHKYVDRLAMQLTNAQAPPTPFDYDVVPVPPPPLALTPGPDSARPSGAAPDTHRTTVLTLSPSEPWDEWTQPEAVQWDELGPQESPAWDAWPPEALHCDEARAPGGLRAPSERWDDGPCDAQVDPWAELGVVEDPGLDGAESELWGMGMSGLGVPRSESWNCLPPDGDWEAPDAELRRASRSTVGPQPARDPRCSVRSGGRPTSLSPEPRPALARRSLQRPRTASAARRGSAVAAPAAAGPAEGPERPQSAPTGARGPRWPTRAQALEHFRRLSTGLNSTLRRWQMRRVLQAQQRDEAVAWQARAAMNPLLDPSMFSLEEEPGPRSRPATPVAVPAVPPPPPPPESHPPPLLPPPKWLRDGSDFDMDDSDYESDPWHRTSMDLTARPSDDVVLSPSGRAVSGHLSPRPASRPMSAASDRRGSPRSARTRSGRSSHAAPAARPVSPSPAGARPKSAASRHSAFAPAVRATALSPSSSPRHSAAAAARARPASAQRPRPSSASRPQRRSLAVPPLQPVLMRSDPGQAYLVPPRPSSAVSSRQSSALPSRRTSFASTYNPHTPGAWDDYGSEPHPPAPAPWAQSTAPSALSSPRNPLQPPRQSAAPTPRPAAPGHEQPLRAPPGLPVAPAPLPPPAGAYHAGPPFVRPLPQFPGLPSSSAARHRDGAPRAAPAWAWELQHRRMPWAEPRERELVQHQMAVWLSRASQDPMPVEAARAAQAVVEQLGYLGQQELHGGRYLLGTTLVAKAFMEQTGQGLEGPVGVWGGGGWGG